VLQVKHFARLVGMARSGRAEDVTSLSWYVQSDGKLLSEEVEIIVGGQDGQLMAMGYGTEQEIRIRALNVAGTAIIIKFRGSFVILGKQFQVWEGAQVVTEFFELPDRTYS
jgi:hypothetical protein